MTLAPKSIIIFGNYPIDIPRHGGQKRAHALLQTIRPHYSSVEYISVYDATHYSSSSTNNIPLGPLSRKRLAEDQNYLYNSDIVCGDAIMDDPIVKKSVTRLLKILSPDIIILEQPFIYSGLKALLKELGLAPKLVYDSQNVEAPMRRQILMTSGFSSTNANIIYNDIRNNELTLVNDCDLLSACTQSDLDYYKTQGAKHTVLAKNGTTPIISSSDQEERWREFFKKRNINKVALFVGSSHLPNYVGFNTMISKGVGFLPYGTTIALAGEISDFINTKIPPVDHTVDPRDVVFRKKVTFLGKLSELRLQSLLSVADVILLPITEGGGSNLKTAEAVATGKPIVATSHAIRSFEWIKNLPNVWVNNDPAEYRKNIVSALTSKPRPRSSVQQKQAKSVLWDNCFRELTKELMKL